MHIYVYGSFFSILGHGRNAKRQARKGTERLYLATYQKHTSKTVHGTFPKHKKRSYGSMGVFLRLHDYERR